MTSLDLEAIEARWQHKISVTPYRTGIDAMRCKECGEEWFSDESEAHPPYCMTGLSRKLSAALHAATQERDRRAARVGALTAAIEAFLSNGHLDRMADGSARYIVRGELPYVLLQEALEACALATPRAEVE